jgi:PPK2 family polyphosphate:nucleotide phosphotransferase
VARTDVRKLHRARLGPSHRVSLADVDPGFTNGLTEKKSLKKLDKQHAKLFDLQDRLWAEHRNAILICLQAMDTGGKDGTVKHVMTGLNPMGIDVHSFKAPTPEEQRHHFLWRFKQVLPHPGLIVILNRTHYEDVLVARVKKLAEPETIERRYSEINRWEKQLGETGITIVKFYLHISYEEQRKRLIERLLDPTKHWKFSENDINERAYWNDYMSAYEIAISRCNTGSAPWYVIPANNKWYRDWAVAQILVETISELNPQYPQVELDVGRLLARLQAD